MEFPDDLQYTREHEWARVEGQRVTIGITDFAQTELGDVVYVELPAVGSVVEAMGTFGVVESVKAVSDLYAPISGTVVEVNTRLEERPELVNHSPYGEGWMIVLHPSDPGECQHLLSAAAYRAYVAQDEA
jgi:glycine cleavage system H protein